MRHASDRAARLLLVLLAVTALSCLAATLPGCNTVEGAGQDLQDASRGVRDAINGDD